MGVNEASSASIDDVDPRPELRTRTAAQRLGDDAEALVAERLTDQGWTILARNIHVGRHELDLVAVDPGPPPRLPIIEVQLRSPRAVGRAEETVDFRKRRNIRDAAWRMITAGTLPDGRSIPAFPPRFDIIVVEPDPPRLRHHRAAF